MSAKIKFIIFTITLPFIAVVYGLFSKHYDISLNALFTIVCIIAFAIIHKKFSVLTDGTACAVIIFILLSIFMGRTLNMYSVVPHWDKGLHFLSGFIIAPIGIQIFSKLNGKKNDKRLMNIFALSLAMALAGLWEIYEFSVDSIFGTSAQNGSLSDTMIDIIAGSISAAIWLIAAPWIKKLSKRIKGK